MPLIDHTFFIGEIKIPNADKTEVFNELIHFIYVYEDKFLTDVLGYELYKAFKVGLTEDPVQQKWVDLLAGAEYTYNDRTYKWRGLISDAVTSGTSLNGYNYKVPELIQVGVTKQTDGITNVIEPLSTTFTRPSWIGWKIIPERIGFGTMKENISYTYNRSTGRMDVLDSAFVQDEFFFFQFILNVSTTSIAVNATKKSMIANYIYYWWAANAATDTTGIGEVVSKTDNATRVNPMAKMVKAWNEMQKQVWELVAFIRAKGSTYTDWTNYDEFEVNSSTWRGYNNMYIKDVFRPINAFNL